MRTFVRVMIVAMALFAGGYWASAAPPGEVTERLTFYHGDPVEGVSGVTFDGKAFAVPGRDPIPINDVQSIEFQVSGPERQTASKMSLDQKLTPLAEEQLKKGAALAKKYPGAPGVILVDDGEFDYHKDGTDAYRYHFAGVVQKEEMKAWAQVSVGFTEGRSRARIVFGRAIGRDGAVTTLTDDMIKVGSPSEDLQFFNPNRKVLSGVIPGVEVGSIVEYSYEYENYNPEDPRLFSPGFFFQGGEPVALSRVKVSLPKGVPFHYTARHFPDPSQEKPKVEEQGEAVTYTWQLESVAPLTPEPLMPPDPDLVPMMEGSVFKDINDVFGLLRGLQEPRLKRTPAIDAKVNEIVQGAQSVDEKIARIYYWVQENTRYISIKGSLGAGFSGHTAQETFDNRYGDCTDKAILFSTMLQSVGVESYPVIVRTNDSGTAVTEIPTLSGNHCISELCLDGRRFFLDSTAQDYRYPYFRADDHGVSAINAIRGAIETIPVPPPSDNRRVSRLDVVVQPNGDTEVRTRNEYNGNIEAGIRSVWKHVREDERKPRMAEYVNTISPGGMLEDFALENLEDAAKPLAMTIRYALPRHGIRAKDLLYLTVPTLERDYFEVSLETRRYPIQYMTTEERILEIDLAEPAGFHVKWLPPPLDIVSPYVEYHAKYEEANGHIQLRETFRRLQRIVPVADYAAYRDALRAIAAFSKQEIFLTEKG